MVIICCTTGDAVKLGKKIRNLRTLYGQQEPKQVTFAITSHCNMVCTTCSFPKIPKNERKHVKFKEARYAVDFLVNNGVRMISITGGEPLLHPRFMDICRYITDKKIMISYISTNGLLITDELANELSEQNVNIVGLSIDVLDEKGNGVTRKVNIEKTITKAKNILDKYDIDTYAGLVLGHHTEDISEVLRTARTLGFSKIIFSYPQINMASSYLVAAEIDKLKGDTKFWSELVTNILKEKRWNTKVDIFNTRVNLNEFLSFYNGTDYTFNCPGGRVQFYLDWNLDLYRCLNSSEKYGNLREIQNLDFKYVPCSACTQQAHRDYASFYHAFKVVRDLEAAGKALKFREVFQILGSKKNRCALNSLFEGYLGGFV